MRILYVGIPFYYLGYCGNFSGGGILKKIFFIFLRNIKLFPTLPCLSRERW